MGCPVITGGWNDNGSLRSSEYVWNNGTATPGKDMPLAIRMHSMVAINDSTIMVIASCYYLLEMDDDCQLI